MTVTTLPAWDLTDFYPSFTAPEVNADQQSAARRAAAFKNQYQGFFTQNIWSGQSLFDAIEEYEAISDLLGKLMSYAYLTYATQMTVPAVTQFFQQCQEHVTAVSGDLIFFTLDLNKIAASDLETAYTNTPHLLTYKPWIEQIRQFLPHQLSEDMERLFQEKGLSGRSAWVRLYDETLATLPFSYKGETLLLPDVLNHMSALNPADRKEAARALSEGLAKALPLFTLVTNTLAKDKEIDDRWHRFASPMDARHLDNQVEPAVVDALSAAVKRFYPRLAHRYYALKARWMGVDAIDYWDRNAPYPGATDETISWDEAKTIVFEAYHDFSPTLASLGQKFFDNAWIDVPPRDGKQSGAFSHPTVPAVHPYIMLNYHGKLRDVMTLAHELGHGVHQLLAAKQGGLLSNTPLTIAETASVFGEMLTFKALLARSTSPTQRRHLIAAKIEDMLNTVVRQIAFYDFEQQVHTRRREGELSADDLNTIWMQTQEAALGPSVPLDPMVSSYWAYISHFIHAPFYVYAYAFGDCLVNSLYGVYESGYPNFEPLYLELLASGGRYSYKDLLQPFGLNAQDPEFWEKGLCVVEALINEFEACTE